MLRRWNSNSVFGFTAPKRTYLCICFCIELKEIECQNSLQLSLPFFIQILTEYYMLNLDYFWSIKSTL